ncbi:hypothetical protein NDU88_004269 [Pleurodeles waltl]|uniref:Uncharacterized protein n=1 Tax=Pleurodeles waltl TaxID=8319 RepID=A0AAV7KX89_PLEWA|nr:hypothetical protein NDU88_004269 [Pleurodeles waltl]
MKGLKRLCKEKRLKLTKDFKKLDYQKALRAWEDVGMLQSEAQILEHDGVKHKDELEEEVNDDPTGTPKGEEQEPTVTLEPAEEGVPQQ